MEKPRIGITVGDLNGVGLEVALKTIADLRIYKYCNPMIYGSAKVVSYHKNIIENSAFDHSDERLLKDRIHIVNCWNDVVSISLGQINEDGGKYAMLSLERAVEDLRAGKLDAIVTSPIHKKALQLAGHGYVGHTEYLRQVWPDANALMLLVGDNMRVGLVTEHVPIKDVANKITKELVLSKINTMHQSLMVDFGIEKPAIAVLGLNPHAGDEGLIGKEEENIIRPAIVESKKSGMIVMGPFPADGFFGSGKYKKFDGILAMYHDQGLAPFKALSFGSGVNFTAGLPIVRTSPDHGTAFDIAGKNEANPESFRKSLFLAIDIVRNRKDYYDLKSNAVQRHTFESETEDTPIHLDEFEQ
jgi:4-phospho-D-threonate 3-dehydrogenase / 4-phospho-D-erythronate 3-dehydrogenase